MGWFLQAVPRHSDQRYSSCQTARHAIHRQLHARKPLHRKQSPGHGLQPDIGNTDAEPDVPHVLQWSPRSSHGVREGCITWQAVYCGQGV